MNHWAADLFLVPYRDGSTDCWWLVCEVLRRRLDLNVEASPSPEGVRAVRSALAGLDLRPIKRPTETRELDVVFGRDLRGERHVMVLVQFGSRLEALHSTRETGVIRERLDLVLLQMTELEIWRSESEGEETLSGPELAAYIEEPPKNREQVRVALQVAAIVISLYNPGLAPAMAALNFAYNLLVPPKQPKQPDAAEGVFSSSLSGNIPRLNDPIPKVCGRVKFTPPFAALPYQRFEPSDVATPERDRDQIFHSILTIGLEESVIEKVIIGKTSILHFQDILENKALAPGEQPTRAKANIVTSTEVSGSELEDGRYVGGIAVCRPGDRCVAISVDVGASQGLGKTDSGGGSSSRTASWQVEVREIDDYGRPVSDWQLVALESRTDDTNNPQRWTSDYVLSAPIRPEVRLVRTDTKGTTANIRDGIQWIGLRGELERPAPLNAQTQHYEIVMRGSDQLSQVSQRDVSVIARGMLRTYEEGVGWSVDRVESRTPGWWALDFLRAAKFDEVGRRWGLNEPDERIDIPAFVAFAETNELRQDRFDFYFNERAEGWDTLVGICRAGRGRPFRRNGVISVVRDELIDAPVRAFTTRNTEPDSIRINPSLPRREQPDGVIAQYLSNVTWAVESIECASPGREPSGQWGTIEPLLGYASGLPTMENPIVIFYSGVTGRTHAEREGIYDAADLVYRKTTATCDVEMEGAVVAYLDPCLLMPEYPGYGQAGDVTFWDEDTLVLTLSEPPRWAEGPLFLTLRNDQNELTDPVEVFPGPTAYDVILPEAPDFPLVLDAGNRERPQYLLGHPTTGTELVKVQNRTARVEQDGSTIFGLDFVIDDERVHTADNALLPGPGDLQDPVDDGSDFDDSGGGIAALVRLKDTAIQAGNDGTPDDTHRGGLVRFTLRTDGAAAWYGESDADGSPSDGGDFPGMWLTTAVDPSTAALYEVLAENTDGTSTAAYVAAGAVFTGTIGSWLPLSSERFWEFSADDAVSVALFGPESITVLLRLKIRRIAAPSIVLSSSRVALSVSFDNTISAGV